MTETKTKNNLNLLRAERKLSQRQLAKELSVTQGMISGWETGRYDISSEDAIRIARFFNVTTDYLLGKTGFLEGAMKRGSENINSDHNNAELAYSLLTQMSKEQQKTAIRLLKALAEES